MIYGRRKGARSWQEHFDFILRSEEAWQRGFTVESHPKCPILYYVREADGVIELHVDDGHGCGKGTIVALLLAFLSEIEMKYVQGIWSGSYEYLKTLKVRDEKKLTSIPSKKYLQSALNKLEMGDCKKSVSPKLDKACIDGDSEELDEGQTSRFRSSVCCISATKGTDIQSTVQLLCTKLKNPTALEMRRLKRVLRYVKGTEDMSTVFEVRDNNDRREQLVKRLEVYTDSVWESDQTSRTRVAAWWLHKHVYKTKGTFQKHGCTFFKPEIGYFTFNPVVNQRIANFDR